VSNNVPLGGGLIWPSSGVFVQIDEGGNQSVAEAGTFIPHREEVLANFLGCGIGGGGSGSGSGGGSGTGSGSGSGVGSGSGDGLTIDGRPVDSPN
jgi:hypothetical protein